MASEGTFPKTDGDILYASEVNSFNGRVLTLYTGSDLDGTNTTESYELPEMTFGNVEADYIKVNINAHMVCSIGLENYNASIQTEIEIQEIGGSYSTIYDETFGASGSPNTDRDQNSLSTISMIKALTAGEKTNGFQLKVTITRTASGGNAVFTNKQIWVEQLN